MTKATSPEAVGEGAWLPSLSRRVQDLPPRTGRASGWRATAPGAVEPRAAGAPVGTGTRGRSALDVADDLLGGGPARPGRPLAAGAEGERGLGRAKAARVLAALELGARLARERPRRRARLPHARGGRRATCCRATAARPVETFGLLALDVRHRLKHEAVISVGCLTSSLVHPREVFQEAVVARAAALVLFHNHPSGDPEPSAEDVALTRRLAAAGTLMGIEVLDHLVLGAGRFVSLKERGVL